MNARQKRLKPHPSEGKRPRVAVTLTREEMEALERVSIKFGISRSAAGALLIRHGLTLINAE